MRVVILQPSYLPWLGYFDQMCKSDIFVIYDDVQYDKNSWRNRNRIKTSQGWQWLTVPVLLKGRNFPLNRDVEINNGVDWQSKHLKSIIQNYRQAAFFADFIGSLESVLTREWKFLIELNVELLSLLKKRLGFQTEICMASELTIAKVGKTERLIEICRRFGADSFLEGDAGKNYIDESLFSNAGIRLEYHQYQHPVYRQLHGDFIPYLSVVDLLFNHGSESGQILTNRKTIT
jgi:hypothetical protein